MRKISSLEDAQLVLNDLLNFKKQMEVGAQNLKGNRVMNLGNGTLDSDAATVGQLNEAIAGLKPQAENKPNTYRTILWSNSALLASGDILPPYCIVNSNMAGSPVSVWVAANTQATDKSLKINIKYLDNSLLIKDLELPKNSNGPAYSSAFINPIPLFGINSFIYPVITQAGNVAAITIGLVIKNKNG